MKTIVAWGYQYRPPSAHTSLLADSQDFDGEWSPIANFDKEPEDEADARLRFDELVSVRNLDHGEFRLVRMVADEPVVPLYERSEIGAAFKTLVGRIAETDNKVPTGEVEAFFAKLNEQKPEVAVQLMREILVVHKLLMDSRLVPSFTKAVNKYKSFLLED